MEYENEMRVFGDLPFASSSILSIKEEVEISETQLREQVFDAAKVKQSDVYQSFSVEKRSEIINGIRHEKEDDQTGLNDFQVNTNTYSKTIKEQSNECNLYPEEYTNSAGTDDRAKPLLKNNHTCSVCAKSYRSKSKLEVHMNSHTGSRPYACIMCPKKYSSLDSLRKHKLTHVFLNAEVKNCSKLKCTLCEKSYNSRARLNSHMNFHRGKCPFKCEICPKSFRSVELLLRHSKTHSDDRKYECTLCNQKFICNSDWRKHEKRHSNEHLKFQCENCKNYFRLEEQYHSHLEYNKCKSYASEGPFQCAKCDNESFASIELLNRHKVQAHPPAKKNHPCSFCAETFSSRYRLEMHTNVHTGSRPYRCTICPKQFVWPQSLRRHMLTHNSFSADAMTRSRFKCTLCEKSYVSRVRLNSHMEFHRSDRRFKCKICPKSFGSEDTLSSHNKTHSDDGKYECTLCNKKFSYNSHRRRHEKTHSNGDLNFQCENCKKYFRFQDQYDSHLEENKCKGYASEMPFQCSKCVNESFASIELLNKHKAQVHPTPIKNHACLVCAKTFISRFRLDMHKNVHTGSRPYACSVCPRKYSSSDSLRKHKLAHDSLSAEANNYSKFKCVLCEKSYSSKARLNSHMNFHRGKCPFKCEICPKSFRSEELLLRHSKTHSDDRKYECTLCSQKFICNSDWRKHEKRHLNEHLKFQCENCKNYFRLEEQYHSHLEYNKCKVSASEAPFQCAQCDNESFASIDLLNRHKIHIHPPSKKNHACSVCAKTFNSKYRLEMHMNFHTGSRPYACTICPKRYGWPCGLRKHMLNHSPLRVEMESRSRHKCTLCDEAFKSKSLLKSHMDFHRSERSFKCEICTKSFKNKELLLKHNKTHSNGSGYVGENEKCGKRIQTQNEVETIQTNEELHKENAMEKKYKCYECNKEFICKRNLHFHLRTHLRV